MRSTPIWLYRFVVVILCLSCLVHISGCGLSDSTQGGITFIEDELGDSNNSGDILDPIDADGDGLSKSQEDSCGTSDLNNDSDQDGLNDRVECNIAGPECNATNPDTDGDGVLDAEEWTLSLGYGNPTCFLDDHDNDGDPRDTDCDDDNPDRFHGNEDALDGRDTNCEIDAPSCPVKNAPGSCANAMWDIGFDIFSGSLEQLYCLGVEVVPGPEIDPFIDATVRLHAVRFVAAGVDDDEKYSHYAYQTHRSLVDDDDDEALALLQCGPNGGEAQILEFNFGDETDPFCEYQANRWWGGLSYSEPNYTRIMRAGPSSLLYTLESRMTKYHIGDVNHEQNGGGHWDNGFQSIYEASCQFGD